MIKINLPIFFKISIIKLKQIKNIYIYDNFYYISLFLSFKKWDWAYFNKNTNSIKISGTETLDKKTDINNFLKKFFKKINSYYFIKIKFKGKGHKISISKKKKIIVFFFGSINTKLLKINKTKIKKINKYKFILKTNNQFNLQKTKLYLENIKSINPYTLRGIRLSRSKIIKKKGKKGVWI